MNRILEFKKYPRTRRKGIIYIPNKKMNKVNIGIIGTGRMGQARLESFSSIKEAHIKWICSRSLEQAKAIGGKNNIMPADDWEKAVSDDSLDAVVITSPNALHHKMVMKSFEEGKHVFLEYPIATNTVDAKEMIDTAASKGLVFHVGLNHRINPANQILKNQLLKLGNPTYYHTAICTGNPISRWFDNKELLGNIFTGSLYHFIDEAISIFGSVQHVTGAYNESLNKDGKIRHDFGCVNLQFGRGSTGQIAYARGYPKPGLVFDRKVICTGGYLVVKEGKVMKYTPQGNEILEIPKDNSIQEDSELFIRKLQGKAFDIPYSARDALESLSVAERAWELRGGVKISE